MRKYKIHGDLTIAFSAEVEAVDELAAAAAVTQSINPARAVPGPVEAINIDLFSVEEVHASAF